MVASERGPLVLGGIPNDNRGGRIRLIERLSPEPPPAGVVWNLEAESPAKNRQGAFLWSQQLFVFGGNNSLGQHDFEPQNFVSSAWRLDLGALEWRALVDFPAPPKTSPKDAANSASPPGITRSGSSVA